MVPIAWQVRDVGIAQVRHRFISGPRCSYVLLHAYSGSILSDLIYVCWSACRDIKRRVVGS